MECGKNLAESIDAVIEQIEAIHDELNEPSTDPATGLAVAKAPLDAVYRLKNSVDQFRLFLWAYVDSRAANSSDTASRLRHLRIERAAEMLGQLSCDFRDSGVPPTQEAARLREQIHAIEPMMAPARPLRPSGTER